MLVVAMYHGVEIVPLVRPLMVMLFRIGLLAAVIPILMLMACG
jgi:hypothetical protein